MHAHALVRLVGGPEHAMDGGETNGGETNLSEATVRTALLVIYSIRCHWGRACTEGKYLELLQQLFDWAPLNEASGIVSPVQLLLALCALDWPGQGSPVEKLTVPTLLGLYNEILSRRARASLRAETSSNIHAETSACAHKILRATLGVSTSSAPQAVGTEEVEASMEAVREGCSRTYSLAASLPSVSRSSTAFELSGKPDAKTTLCLAFPRDSSEMAAVQGIRRMHDPAFVRWPPHVNLLWPFVPRADLVRVEPLLRAELASLPPFQLRLATFSVLCTRNQHTIVLEADATEMTPLHAALARLIPACAGGKAFHAHLTVAKADPADAQRLCEELQRGWTPLSVAVNAVSLMWRDGDVPYQDACEPLRLSGSAETADMMEAEGQSAEDEIALAAIAGGDAINVRQFVVSSLRQARRVVHFARALQQEVSASGGWSKLMEAMEANAADGLIGRLVKSTAVPPTLIEELELKPADVPRTCLRHCSATNKQHA